MPEAHPELRRKMDDYFGDPVSDDGPIRFLESRGFRLTRGWQWVAPADDYTPDQKEFDCLCFLMDEWDFGGVVKAENADLPLRGPHR